MYTNIEEDRSYTVVIVAAMSKYNRAIGMNNKLLWHVPADLKRFMTLTLGKPVIMGRKTFESIVEIIGKPLPKRQNIVVTRNKDFKYDGVEVAISLEEALLIASASDPTEIHIGGGAEMYKQSLPYVDKIYLTVFDDQKEGDTFFPVFESEFVEVDHTLPYKYKNINYEWVDYARKF